MANVVWRYYYQTGGTVSAEDVGVSAAAFNGAYCEPSSDLRAIRISGTVRSLSNAQFALVNITINADSGANTYRVFRRFMQNTAAMDTATGALNSYYYLGYAPGATTGAGIFGSFDMTVGGWDGTNNNCQMSSRSGYTESSTNCLMNMTVGAYLGAAPYRSIEVWTPGGFANGSAVLFEGLK